MNDPETHRERLRAAAERVLRDRHEAEDVVQEVLLRAEGAATVPREGWFHAVCYRLAVDRLRVRRRFRRAISGLSLTRAWFSDPVADSERAAEQERVRAGLGTLDEPYRSAVRLRYLEELAFSAIAERLETNERTARTWVGRGLVKLRRKLEERP